MADTAINFVVDFMADNLECFALSRKKKSAENCCEKSRVAALEILDIDEASTEGNIAILERFYADTNKSDSSPQVFPRLRDRFLTD